MSDNFLEIEYLQSGNKKQINSYKILKNNNIMKILEKFNPVLVGTIPINIDLDKSDLDIVCEVDNENFYEFEKLLNDNFIKYKDYRVNIIEDKNIIISNFYIENIEIEIYASYIKSKESNGYRHMIIENRILNLLGEDFRNKVIELKKQGYKTEPAFAKLLNLVGNPYEQLLELENYEDNKIIELINKQI